MASLTQYQKIIYLMAKYDRWFYIYDFQKENLKDIGLFVGHKAPARINELEHDYPNLFITKKKGSFVLRKLNIAEIKDWYFKLDNKLKHMIIRAGIRPTLSEEEILSRNNLRFEE